MRACYSDEENGRQDNYRMVCDKWREIYLDMDREKLKERFHLEVDEGDPQAMYITYFNQRYRLDQESGMITKDGDPDGMPSFNTLMAIYHLFYYSKEDARVRGEFVPYRQVKRAAPFAPAFERTVLKPLAKKFEGQVQLLDKACRAMNGKPISQGDAGYVIQAFDCIPLEVIFWDGDEEFEAQANILFDADITDFLHEETVVCVGADLARRLAEEAGLGEIDQLLGDSYNKN